MPVKVVNLSLELWHFGLKQARASLFGGLLLIGILVTRIYYPDTGIARYDFLFLYAVLIQICLVVFRLESIRELLVIFLFHGLATLMEIFKTSDSIGSWEYPGSGILMAGNVPLFAGFMYSAVGSYIARSWRLLDLSFTRFPPLLLATTLAVLAYLNFFTHHYIVDIRWVLLIGCGFAYFRCSVHFMAWKERRSMNLLVGFALIAFFVWSAENAATFAQIWIYPNQKNGWEPVGWGKLSAWFLLIQLSFCLIYLLRQFEASLARGKFKPWRWMLFNS